MHTFFFLWLLSCAVSNIFWNHANGSVLNEELFCAGTSEVNFSALVCRAVS